MNFFISRQMFVTWNDGTSLRIALLIRLQAIWQIYYTVLLQMIPKRQKKDRRTDFIWKMLFLINKNCYFDFLSVVFLSAIILFGFYELTQLVSISNRFLVSTNFPWPKDHESGVFVCTKTKYNWLAAVN